MRLPISPSGLFLAAAVHRTAWPRGCQFQGRNRSPARRLRHYPLVAATKRRRRLKLAVAAHFLNRGASRLSFALRTRRAPSALAFEPIREPSAERGTGTFCSATTCGWCSSQNEPVPDGSRIGSYSSSAALRFNIRADRNHENEMPALVDVAVVVVARGRFAASEPGGLSHRRRRQDAGLPGANPPHAIRRAAHSGRDARGGRVRFRLLPGRGPSARHHARHRRRARRAGAALSGPDENNKNSRPISSTGSIASTRGPSRPTTSSIPTTARWSKALPPG